MSEEERDREGGQEWKDDVAVEAGFCGLEAGGCCLFNLLTAIVLFCAPVSALLMVHR